MLCTLGWLTQHHIAQPLDLIQHRFATVQTVRTRPDWMTPCAFAQGEQVHALWSLQERSQWQGASVPLCPLGEHGKVGSDRRDI